MYRIILPMLIISSIAVTYADSAMQTDWSGGPGVWGPVTKFGIEFYSDSGIEYYSSSPGKITLCLIGNTVTHPVDDDFDGARSVHSADFDGDGDMDILGGCSWGPPDICWWENLNGSGTSWTEHTVDDNFYHAYSVYSEDIDSDGDMDILGTSSWNDEIAWWENLDGSGASWVKHVVAVNFDGANSVYSEDIDGDGDPDIIGGAFTGNIAWWENLDGSGVFWTKHDIDFDFDGERCVYSEDVDGDGDMDILGAGGATITWWENVTGSGTLWGKHIIGHNFQAAYSVYSEDIDGDGDMDVLGAASQGVYDDISWWENADGIGTSWIKHIVHGYFFLGARSVYSADMDNDGDMDILGAGYYEADINWFENLNGLGTSWSNHLVDGSFGGANSVYSEDINGDGIKDIIGAAWDWDLITWWDILTYPPEGSLMSSVLDTECSPAWSDIDWSATEPSGTSVGFQVRSSNDPDSSAMGSWSDTLYSPCSLEGILTDGEQYVQYRVILETPNLDVSPTLHDVTLFWNPFGIQGGSDPDSFELLPIYPNPATDSPVIMFGLPELSSVKLFIFDISGRLIETTPLEEYSSGYHSIVLGDLSPGIYFCRMLVGNFSTTQSFAVVE